VPLGNRQQKPPTPGVLLFSSNNSQCSKAVQELAAPHPSSRARIVIAALGKRCSASHITRANMPGSIPTSSVWSAAARLVDEHMGEHLLS